MESGNRPVPAKRKTPLPVPPPRIPTPMPVSNNNNLTKSSHAREQVMKIHPSSVAVDGPQLISKASYKLLDNDVKTAWINPRLISKVDMDMVRSSDYLPPSERNMNGHYNHNLSHQKQGRVHDREWEPLVNGRAKPRLSAVPTLTQSASDTKREKADRKNTRQSDVVNKPLLTADLKLTTKQVSTRALMEAEKLNRACVPSVKAHANSSRNNKYAHVHKNVPQQRPPEKLKGVGYQSATAAGYVGGGLTIHESGVFGVYSETKYIFAVNGLPANPAQASAAAAFFAR